MTLQQRLQAAYAFMWPGADRGTARVCKTKTLARCISNLHDTISPKRHASHSYLPFHFTSGVLGFA